MTGLNIIVLVVIIVSIFVIHKTNELYSILSKSLPSILGLTLSIL